MHCPVLLGLDATKKTVLLYRKERKMLGPDGIKTVGLQLNGWKFWWFFPELVLLFCHALSCVCGASIALCPGTALTVGINVCCQIQDLVVLWVLEEGNDPYDLT